jgi:hypothetical protein
MSSRYNRHEAPFSALMGETLTEITGLTEGSDTVTFRTASGRTFRMFHLQDCCETVEVNEIIGNVEDLIGSPITMADEATNSQEDRPTSGSDSWTWTFYRLATVQGYVTIRWLGESNGYYSEAVDFAEISPRKPAETRVLGVFGDPFLVTM